MTHWSNGDLAAYRKRGAAKVKKVRKVNSIQKPVSEIEAIFDIQMRVEKIPKAQMNYQFEPTRGWMLDRAWPDLMLAVEIDGMVHRIKQRFESDCEKFAHATIAGWTVLHVTGKNVRNRKGIEWLKQLLAKKYPAEAGQG